MRHDTKPTYTTSDPTIDIPERFDSQGKTRRSDKEIFFLVKNRRAAQKLVSTLEEEEKPEIRDIRAITAIDSGDKPIIEEPDSVQPKRSSTLMLLDVICGTALGVNLTLLASQWMPPIEHTLGSVALLGLSAATLLGVCANRFLRDTRHCSLAEFLPELEKGRVLVLVRVKPTFKRFVLSLSTHLMRKKILTAGELQSPEDSVTLSMT